MQEFECTSQVYIFGAQSRAKTLKGYLQFLFPQTNVLSFLVDDTNGNETSIDGIPVQTLASAEKLDSSCKIFIATKGMYHPEITERLHKKGLNRIVPVTFEVDNLFRNAYVNKYYKQKQLNFIKLKELSVQRPSAVIYTAKSIYDRPLNTKYIYQPYERAIQVGAALTSQRISSDILTDCEGENISVKNRQYCELTAMYWIWKNAREEIVGLTHYRRHFILSENWQDIMITNDIDVILPVPTVAFPNIEVNYKERHDPDDWGYLMSYLEAKYPKDYNVAVQLFSESLYYPCNMFIMRRQILDDLCKWMFPILDAVVAHGGRKEDSYWNRYPGFLSERLITLYFHKNRYHYKIVFADKNFIC